eukprot:11241763-Alexandrium_andersonii.AAC.1
MAVADRSALDLASRTRKWASARTAMRAQSRTAGMPGSGGKVATAICLPTHTAARQGGLARPPHAEGHRGQRGEEVLSILGSGGEASASPGFCQHF